MKKSLTKNSYIDEYILKRPLFLALIRSLEISFYIKQEYGKKILDYGCGDGYFTQTLINFFPKLFGNKNFFGFDINRNSLKVAEKVKIYKKLSFQKKEFGNDFNGVIANCVFEHLEKPKEELRWIRSRLKKGGKLYCTVMTDKWEENLFLPKRWWRKKQKHVNLYSIKQWQNYFKEGGFKILNSEVYLNSEQCRWMEWLHFISLPYLISYVFWKDWSKVGRFYDLWYKKSRLREIFTQEAKAKEAGAAFFLLQK